MTQDQRFLAGDFLAVELPNEKKYLLKYFTSEIQRAFVVYYFSFDSIENFTDHTGHHCTPRWVRFLRQRIEALQAAHRRAKQDFDFVALSAIEDGNFKLPKGTP